ncbi:hypothetical protein SANTM175S_05543 [Streptomyces antimycoticus]
MCDNPHTYIVNPLTWADPLGLEGCGPGIDDDTYDEIEAQYGARVAEGVDHDFQRMNDGSDNAADHSISGIGSNPKELARYLASFEGKTTHVDTKTGSSVAYDRGRGVLIVEQRTEFTHTTIQQILSTRRDTGQNESKDSNPVMCPRKRFVEAYACTGSPVPRVYCAHRGGPWRRHHNRTLHGQPEEGAGKYHERGRACARKCIWHMHFHTQAAPLDLCQHYTCGRRTAVRRGLPHSNWILPRKCHRNGDFP